MIDGAPRRAEPPAGPAAVGQRQRHGRHESRVRPRSLENSVFAVIRCPVHWQSGSRDPLTRAREGTRGGRIPRPHREHPDATLRSLGATDPRRYSEIRIKDSPLSFMLATDSFHVNNRSPPRRRHRSGSRRRGAASCSTPWPHDSRLEITTASHPIGGAALRQGLPALPPATLDACRAAKAVLLGAVGDPAFDHLPSAERPEGGLLALRKGLGVYANLRPARIWPGCEGAGPLKPEIVEGCRPADRPRADRRAVLRRAARVRRRTGAAFNTMRYSVEEIARIARVAFDAARRRRRKQRHVGGQGERARDVAALAGGS